MVKGFAKRNLKEEIHNVNIRIQLIIKNFPTSKVK